MGWLSKFFKGASNSRVSRGQYPGRSPYIDEQSESELEDLDRAIALSLSEQDQPKGKEPIESAHQLEEDEMLAKALQESLNAESPPQQNGETPPSPPRPVVIPPDGRRICAGCKTPIGPGRFLSCMDSVWHPDCFCCDACDKPISDFEFSMHEDHPYHKNCYRELYHPKCDVCKDFIPTNKNGLIEYRAHPFWMQKYCPSHEDDDTPTPRCCSCERLEPKDVKYITLDDGRKLCLECLNSAIMDNSECQPLYIDIQEFYEGLNMKVEQQVPLLLVERQALNEAMEGEKMFIKYNWAKQKFNRPPFVHNQYRVWLRYYAQRTLGHHHLPETRGLCLSEEQIVRTILRRPVIGPGNKIIDMVTGNHRLVRRCEVTAILILFGLPRLLTGSILAHEMMHAWLRLKGFRSLSPEVEEGICQVLAHMWLESEITSGSSSTTITHTASTSASASTSSSSTSSKKGPKSDFEKKLGEFFKNQIETDTSAAYGEGFRVGNKAVTKYGLRTTLEHIKLTNFFPY